MKLETFRHHVLALMLVNQHFLIVSSVILQPRYFETRLEQHLARFILEHFREFKKCPKKLALLDSIHVYFSRMSSKDTTEDEMVEFVEDILDMRQDAAEMSDFIQAKFVEFCKEQALREAIIKSAEDLQEGKTDQIKPRIEKALSVGAGIEGSGIFWLQESDNMESTEDIREVVSTGLPFIDKPLHGGNAKSELAMIMSPPHTGKTTALVNVGVGAAKNMNKVAHVSLEMKQGLIRAMYDRCFLQRSDDQLQALSSEERDLVSSFLKRVKSRLNVDVNIKSWNPHRLSIEGLKAHLLMLESLHGFKPDALIVDYLHLLQMPTHIRDEIKQLTWVGEELRALGGELNMAVWTATQTGRGALNKQTAMAEDVAGDFQKIAYADHVCSLNQTLEEQNEDMMRIFWVKTRAGKKWQTYNVYTDFNKSKMEPA
jgi:hypothetical protein